MESGANPLNHTSKFYPQQPTASRGNKTGAMQFGQESVGPSGTSGIAFPSQAGQGQVQQAQGGQGQQARPYKTSFKVESKPAPPKF